MIRSKLEVIKEYTSYAPVDVFGMANALGIDVRKVEMPDSRSGKIEKTFDGAFRISINKNHSGKRQRFTVAHELGHYILHQDILASRGGIYDDAMYRDENINSRYETEANKFAASILMPSDLIYKLRMQGFSTAYDLARELDVSEAAVNIRLENV